MKTKAVRLYGTKDIRLEEFELPPLQDDEILAEVVADSLCVSSYKAVSLGASHKRVPNDVAEHPIILGHEFCGKILEVGKKWRSQFSPNEKFAIQPAFNYKGMLDAPGYSFRHIGGNATYVIIPNIAMEQNCLLKYEGDAFFLGALGEPVSCVIGGCNAMYHVPQGTYEHHMGIKEGGKMLMLAGTGPMGLAAIDYCIHADKKPSLLVITSRNEEKLKRAEKIYSRGEAKKQGVDIHYILANDNAIAKQKISQVEENIRFDDVLIMAASQYLVELADDLLAKDGCVNFFAGPIDTKFKAPVNFYNIHYEFMHYVSNSGGNTDDMIQALELCAKGIINPAPLVSHIGGLNAVPETTLNLPNLPGSKKLIYTHKNIPLTSLEDFRERGEKEKIFFFRNLQILWKHTMVFGVWKQSDMY